jgi:peptidylprolyl isomerase
MATVNDGDTVKVHYTGKLENDVVFDTSNEREPLQFTIGEGRVIPGFEEAVAGMEPGESKTANIPADQAYGPYHEEMVRALDRNQLPPDIELEVGQHLESRSEEGQSFIVTVIDISGSTVTLDANHPLAGKDLSFDIELLEIV